MPISREELDAILSVKKLPYLPLLTQEELASSDRFFPVRQLDLNNPDAGVLLQVRRIVYPIGYIVSLDADGEIKVRRDHLPSEDVAALAAELGYGSFPALQICDLLPDDQLEFIHFDDALTVSIEDRRHGYRLLRHEQQIGWLGYEADSAYIGQQMRRYPTLAHEEHSKPLTAHPLTTRISMNLPTNHDPDKIRALLEETTKEIEKLVSRRQPYTQFDFLTAFRKRPKGDQQ